MLDKFFSWCSTHWSQLILLVLAFHTILKAVRDAVDNCPEKYSGIMRCIVIIQLTLGYLLAGIRPKHG